MGRLWQTLILSQWKTSLAYLPVEDVIRQQQQKYYDTLAACDKVADSSQFIEFLLSALLQTLKETRGKQTQKKSPTDQVSDQVTDQVNALLKVLQNGPLSALECMAALKLSHRPTFRKNYLNPALQTGHIERTVPEKPNSRLQKYRLS